jgi:integrase
MHWMTKDELKALLSEVKDPRQNLMLRVGFLHGLRVSELTGLTTGNVKDGFLHVKRLKGSLKTVQPLIEGPDPDFSEKADLIMLCGTLKGGEVLFPMTRDGVRKLMQRAGKRAGVPVHKLHPHSLKHTCAMVGINSMGIHLVRQYLGHKSISSTGAYLNETDEAASKAFIGAL